jgi:kynurenine formamidase
MRSSILASSILIVFGGSASAQFLPGPSADKPYSENWAPSKWGKDDRAGSANHSKNSDNVKRALGSVKQFKSITVGKYYHREIPTFGPRLWNMVLPGTPQGGPFGKNALVYHDEYVTTELGQIGTQFDGPGHIGVNTSKGMFFYNGNLFPQSYERGEGGRAVGMGPNGVEHVGELGFVCRLVVLDAVAYRKSQGRIPATAEMQGLAEIGAGDCVALHTGQGNTWSNDRYKSMSSNERKAARELFAQGEPGFGISACEYMASRDIALMMGDTSANDAQPAGEQGTDYAVPCHTEMQTRRGIWNLENVDTKSLIDAKIYEGAFIWAPLRIVGGTGSPANPVVLY